MFEFVLLSEINRMDDMKKFMIFVVLTVVVLAFAVADVAAVRTVYVEHNSESQFKAGDPNGVVLSSKGEMYLANQVESILGGKNDDWVVNALAKGPDGSLYVATSGRGYIYKIKDGRKPKVIYTPDKNGPKHIFSLTLDNKGRLLAGTGGQKGLLLRFNKNNKPKTLFSDKQINYIWNIVTDRAGTIYLATGPNGKVLRLDDNGKKVEVLYEAKEKNILSLALSDDGIIYAGGDGNGLVYRIDLADKTTTILYDTKHSEISSLVFDPKTGDLYVATSDAEAARPGAKLILSDGDTSRAETADDKENESDGNAEEKSEKKDTKTGKNDKKKDGSKKLIPAATNNNSIIGLAKLIKKPAKTNEVFKITQDGYVSRLFSKAVTILSMAYTDDGELLLGTGNEGKLLRLNVETLDAVVLHTAKPSAQVSAVLVDEDGTVYAGCANPAALIKIEPEYRPIGIYVSEAIDADQPSNWGKIQIEADLPAGADLKVATRSGNTEDADKGGWQGWTKQIDVAEDMPIGSAVGRFLQYKLLFESTDGSATPTVKQVKLAYMVPNLPPRLKDVEVAPAKTNRGIGTGSQIISWKAVDDNGDELSFEVLVRPTGNKRWVRLIKELDDTKHTWDTRTAADGRYEIKVSATDKISNPAGTELTASRLSSVVIVDNTPPEITGLSYELEGKNILVRAKVVDTLSVIGKVEYVLDSGEKFLPALPTDQIFDSREEQITFKCEADGPGEHLLAIRFDDALGNRVYRNVTVDIAE